METGPRLSAAGFFVLRTPLLPVSTLGRLSEDLEAGRTLREGGDLDGAIRRDRVRVTEFIRSLLGDPLVREAIFVASPSLDEAVSAWLVDPASSRAAGVLDVLVRYVVRMAARPTPFGLFSGGTTGTVGGGVTSLYLVARSDYRRHTRLDAGYLGAVCERLGHDPSIREALTFRPSTALYEIGGHYRHAERHVDPVSWSSDYQLVSVDASEYVRAALDAARDGIKPRDLAASINAKYPSMRREDAEAFVVDLIESQLLVSELGVCLTGVEPAAHLMALLESTGAGREAAGALTGATTRMRELDAGGGGAPPDRYREIADGLRRLPTEPDAARLFHVDLHKPARRASLADGAVDDLENIARVLARIAPPWRHPALERFGRAFLERYGAGRRVPLVLALDEEAGVGFGGSKDWAPLLGDLAFRSDRAAPRVPFGPHEERLVRGLSKALRAGKDEWLLDDDDLDALAAGSGVELPDTFAVWTTATMAKDGSLRFVAPVVTGPSGVRLLGRYGHGDSALCEAMRAHLRQEEAMRPEAVFAEIVHLSQGRMGNVVCRPLLRDHEIVYLGESGAAPERRIAVRDLSVAIVGDRIELWSERLEREVIPRLTTAHFPGEEALGVYRFLHALQFQSAPIALGWSWGPLERAPFLPRVTYGRAVLAPARWNLVRSDLEPILASRDAARFAAVQRLRAALALPARVALDDGENLLAIDLENIVAVDSWARLVKGRDTVSLVELPRDDELAVHGPEGRFTAELLVPFVKADRPRAVGPAAARDMRVRGHAGAIQRFTPGSEWLEVRWYVGAASADGVIIEALGLARDARRTRRLRRWFFTRATHPEPHVRACFHGDEKRLAARLIPILRRVTDPLVARGIVSRFVITTYEREVERYAGEEGAALVETVAEADSDAVASILEQLAPHERPDARWRLSLRSADRLLEDLGFDLASRTEIVRESRAELAATLGGDVGLESQLGRRFRAERTMLESLRRSETDDEGIAFGLEALAARSERIRTLRAAPNLGGGAAARPLVTRAVARELVDACCNRMLDVAHETQRLVLFDWLLRLYESEAARARRAD